MKKLLFASLISVTTFSFALTKNDLENTIRSLDVAGVQQILRDEKLTSKEYVRYLNLAEEVVRSREIWIIKNRIYDDVTTPSTIPARKIGFQLLAGIALAIATANVTDPIRPKYLRKYGDVLGGTFVLSATALFFKCLVDILLDVEKRKSVLRKKYDDAVTIKQLVFAADTVVEA